MSASRQQRLAKLRRQWSRNAVAARERNRLQRAQQAADWQPIGVLLVGMRAAPDGRNMAIAVHGCLDFTICGTERSVRSALARAMWRRFKQKRQTPC